MKQTASERATALYHLSREVIFLANQEKTLQNGKLRPSQKHALSIFLREAERHAHMARCEALEIPLPLCYQERKTSPLCHRCACSRCTDEELYS